MPRSAHALVAAAFVVLFPSAALASGDGGTSAPPQGPPRYLSLGDSLAESIQPGPDGRHRRTSQGFAERVWRHLLSRYSDLQLVKLGGGGEPAATMIHGRRPGPSQLQLAEGELGSDSVPLVYIDIG